MDGLIRETKATDCRLHNVFNDFLMLSNTQFIENRVYDEEVEEPVLKVDAEKAEQEKTREQKEVDLIPKVQEAVNYGLQVLDNAFEQLDIKAGNSDSEEEDANERVELILEPKVKTFSSSIVTPLMFWVLYLGTELVRHGPYFYKVNMSLSNFIFTPSERLALHEHCLSTY